MLTVFLFPFPGPPVPGKAGDETSSYLLQSFTWCPGAGLNGEGCSSLSAACVTQDSCGTASEVVPQPSLEHGS